MSRSIRDVFEREGEAYFREIETRVIDELTAAHSGVLATGGGVILGAANRLALRGRSTVIYLKATPRDLLRRLRMDSRRPLLQVSDPLERLKQMYVQRDPLYRDTAHFLIETGRPSVSTLVNMILMQLELGGLVDPENVPSPVDQNPRVA